MASELKRVVERIEECFPFKEMPTVTWINIDGLHDIDVINRVGNVFDLPKLWNSKKFKELREKYNNCSQCNYLCYIAYSLHGSPYGNLLIAKDHWKNAKVFFSKN